MQKPGKHSSTSASESAAGSGSGVGEKRGHDDTGTSSSNPFDCADSPEWDKKTMQKMILKMMSKMPKTPEAEAEEPDGDGDSMQTRSSGKGKAKQKKQKK